ncbi:hypothetical protein [Planctopirus limnophila]|nr:hypothetical protein [Planctopirus limnophila]
MLSPIQSLNPRTAIRLGAAYGDGTVWFSLEDSEGRIAHICIDGRDGSQTRYRLFDGARHPNSPDTVLIELGAPEEGVIVSLASTWLDSGTPKDLGLTEFGWDLICDTLLRIGESH